MSWEIYGECPCGFIRRAPFGSLFHIHLVVCPNCGGPKRDFNLAIMRWNTSKIKWWNPVTYFNGYWERKTPNDQKT